MSGGSNDCTPMRSQQHFGFYVYEYGDFPKISL